MKKIDLRVQKTISSIKVSFIELVKEKGFNKVSVTDIVNKSNINRNTFYLHYESKEDLVTKLVSETAIQLFESISGAEFLKTTEFSNIKEWEIRWGLRNILKFIEPNTDFFKIILLDENLQGYFEKIAKSTKDGIASLLNVTNPKSNLIFEYTMAGIFGLIKNWIINKNTTTTETAKILAQLTYSDLQKFKTIN